MNTDPRLETFESVFRGGFNGCRMRCNCGREFFDNANEFYDWNEGELEELRKTATALDYAPGNVRFEGRKYVDACDCWHPRAMQVIGFLDGHPNNRGGIVKQNGIREGGAVKPIHYVLGFAFGESGEVALVRKANPPWQRGLLNGVGGKMELEEWKDEAMAREWAEEAAGLPQVWLPFMQLTDKGDDGQVHVVHCFASQGDLGVLAGTEREPVELVQARCLPEDVVPNLKWIVPMAWNFLWRHRHGRRPYAEVVQ